MGKLGEETAALKTAIEREVQERKDEAAALSGRIDEETERTTSDDGKEAVYNLAGTASFAMHQYTQRRTSLDKHAHTESITKMQVRCVLAKHVNIKTRRNRGAAYMNYKDTSNTDVSEMLSSVAT